MNNNEIRLSILFQYYRAKFNGKGYGHREENPEIKEIPHEIINANFEYLIDKGLIRGTKSYTTGGIAVFPSDITARGMDIVEKIIDETTTQLESPITTEINKENTTPKKMEKLNEICLKYSAVFDVVVKVAGTIFSNLK